MDSKTNDGLLKIDLSRYQKPQEKKRAIHRWQELALTIIKELKVPAYERGLIFKICCENPEAYVEHCFNETKECAKDMSRASHYFVKLIYKK